MSHFVNRRNRVSKDIVTRVKRRLAGKGQLDVRIGQEVSPDDRIGHSIYPSGFRNINLAEHLAVTPKEARDLLQRPLGQRIYKGELLAFKKGGVLSAKKIITSPTDGILDSFDEKKGELRIVFYPKALDLPAAVFGVVEMVDHLKGEVIIKTQVTEILSLFGSGKIREGIIKIIGTRGDLIDKNLITRDCADYILVGGALIYKDAIMGAVETKVRGIITGGINSRDYMAMSGGRLKPGKSLRTDIGVSILVTEGFGSVPIGEDIYEVLKKFNDQFAIIEGNQGALILPSFESGSMDKIKRAALPPLSEDLVEGRDQVVAIELNLGQVVRVLSQPFLGEQGTVESIDKTLSLLPSQILTYMVTIVTQKRKIRVPYTNLEIIE